METIDLHGKSALVTGSGRGIGAATVRELARRGARVVLTARNMPEIEAVAQQIREMGGEALGVGADVSRPDDVERLFTEAGRVDILVNCAGVIAPIARLADAEPDAWLYNVAVNLDGVFLTCRAALPGMLEREWGRIVNVSSGAARGTTVGWSAYAAAKAGVEALSTVLAREVGERGVHVNAVRPGIVDTEMQVEIRRSGEDQFGRENVDRFRRYKETGLLRQPEDPARLILWLLSPEAADLNGEVLAIDDPEVAARIGLTPRGR
jgi:NAD(P)-dependent dehydrogenase (short-subunit alcohol dehydrogenase family)